MWLYLLSRITGGAFTGYITNSLAVNMLFKKYGPFGGVILESKEEFFMNAAALVEKDIINHNTLGAKLTETEVKEVSRKTIAQLISKYLPQETEGLTLEEIPGFEKTVAQILKELAADFPEYSREYWELFSQNYQISDIISQEQLQRVIDNIFKELTDNFQQDNDLSENELSIVIKIMADDFQNIKMSELISPEIFTAVSDFIVEDNSQFIDKLPRELKSLAEKLRLHDLFEELLKVQDNKTFLELFNCNNTQQLASKANNLLKSEQFSLLLAEIIDHLLDHLEKVDVPVLEVFTAEVSENIDSYLQRELPVIIEKILDWAKENKEQVEVLIENAIRDVLKEGQGFKNKIKRIVFNVLKGNFGESYNLLDKIIQRIEQREDMGSFSRALSRFLLKQIKDKSLGQIINFLRQQRLIEKQQLVSIFQSAIEQIPETKIERLFSKKAGSKFGLLKLFTKVQKNVETTTDFTKKNFIDQFKEIIINLFKTFLTDIKEKKPGDFLSDSSKNRWSKKLGKEIQRYLQNNREDLSQFLAKNTFTTLKQEKINLPPTFFDNLDLNNVRLADIWAGYEQQEVSNIISRLKNEQEVVDNINEIFLELLDKNLPLLLEDKVTEVILENVNQFSDEKIQQTVEDFMGRELRPITTLGAVLGGAAGVGLSFVDNLNPLVSVVTFGLVGFLTNVIALQMVFKPYQEKRILGFKVPFTPGVVAKNKNRFGSSLGRFIEEKLLDPKEVKKIFQSQKKQYKNRVFTLLTEDDCALINNFAIHNSSFLSSKAASILFENILANEEKVAAAGVDYFLSLTPYELGFSASDQFFREGLFPLIKENSVLIAKAVKNSICELDEPFLENIFTTDERFDKEKMYDLFSGLFDFTKKQRDKKINTLVTEENYSLVIDRLVDLLNSRDIIEDIVMFLEEILQEYLAAYFQTEKTISDLFSNSPLNYLEKHQSEVGQWFYEKSLNYLHQKRAALKKEACRAFQQLLTEEKKEKKAVSKLKYYSLESAFNFFDMEETIEEVVDKLIDDQIPGFLATKRDDFIQGARYVFSKISPVKVNDIYSGIDSIQTRKILTSFLENKIVVEGVVQHCTEIFVQKTPGDILNFFGITDADSAVSYFNSELEVIGEYLQSTVPDSNLHLERFNKKMLSYAQQDIKNIFSRIELSQIDHSLQVVLNWFIEKYGDENDELGVYAMTVNNEESSDNKENGNSKQLTQFCDNVFKALSQHKLRNFIDRDLLKKDVTGFLNRVQKDESFGNSFLVILNQQLEGLFNKTPDLVANTTTHYLLELFLNASFASLEDNFIELLTALKIKDTTEEQIEKMEPDKIESLFTSFAGSYFTRLKLYGWLGSGIGGMVEIINLLT